MGTIITRSFIKLGTKVGCEFGWHLRGFDEQRRRGMDIGVMGSDLIVREGYLLCLFNSR